MTNLERTERLRERWFWSIFIIASLVLIYFVLSTAYDEGRRQQACANACEITHSKIINSKCHCKFEGGWRETLDAQEVETP